MMTLQAAWKIDQDGAQAARNEIAMIKYHGAGVMHEVIDRAIQVHGSPGFSTDMPLEQMYRWARASRFYDGPDEVHGMTVARRILGTTSRVRFPPSTSPPAAKRRSAATRIASSPSSWAET